MASLRDWYSFFVNLVRKAATPYVYQDIEEVVGNPAVGTKECVALVMHFGKARPSSLWKEGAAVRGNNTLAKGTAIATFVNGRYENLAHGNHAAFYISQDAGGIWVVDQWRHSGTIRKTYYRFLGKDKNGKYIVPSKNGDAFAVVE